MEIKKIVVSNFLSFKELDFTIPNSGLFFVGGEVIGKQISNSNGAGKSSLFEALCYGLYGKTIRNLGVNDVVNRDVGKDCFVSISFLSGDDEYDVVRFRNHSEFGDDLYLYKNDHDITAESKKVTQEMIDVVTGMNWLVFSTAIVFGEKARRFAEAKESEKNEILNEILMFQPYDDAKVLVKNDIVDLKDKLFSRESDIKTAKAIIEEFESEIEFEKKSLLKVKEDKKNSGKEIAIITNEIDVIAKNIVSLEGDIDIIKSDVENFESDRKVVEVELREISRKRDEELSEPTKKSFDISAKINMYVQLKNNLANDLSDVDNLVVGSKCPTCKSIITKESQMDVRKKITDDINKTDSSIKKLEEELVVVKKVVEDINNKWRKKHTEATVIMVDLEDTISKLESKYRSMVNELNKKEVEKANKIAEIKLIKGNTETIISSIRERIELKQNKAYNQVQGLKTINDDIGKINNDIDYLNFWVNGFSNKGIKSFLLDEVIPELNNRISYYAGALMDNNIRICFDTETKLKSGDIRNKFNIKIFVDGIDVPYSSFSSGEKARIDVAILLALQNLIFHRNTKNSNIVIFDEVFEHLDSTGIEMTVNLLNDESKDKVIFVVSHQNEIKDYFDNYIMVKKSEKGVSYV